TLSLLQPKVPLQVPGVVLPGRETGFLLDWPCLLFLLVYESQELCRIARDNRVSGDVSCNHATCPNDCVFPDVAVAQNSCARTNRRAFANLCFLHFPVGLRLQSSAGSSSSGVHVIDERDAMPDKHVVFDFHSLANEGVA